jgi:neutral ceramidase
MAPSTRQWACCAWTARAGAPWPCSGTGCHPVSLHSYRNLIAPDYPGYARSAIRRLWGEDVTVLFTLGPAGDVNPASFVWKQATPEKSTQMGEALARKVARVAQGIAMDRAPLLRAAVTTVDLPLAPLPRGDELSALRDRTAAEAQALHSAGRPWEKIACAEIDRGWASEALQAVEAGQAQRAQPCEVQALRLGAAALLALPLEVFAETGLAIRRASPALQTLLVSNANGALSYLPTAGAYTCEDYTNPQGRAPKAYGLYALAEPAEPLVRQATLDLLRTLFPD